MLLAALLLACPAFLTAQALPAGIVPYGKGFNLSLGTTNQHDSTNGWSSVLSPAATYRFNHHFSVDASAPIYGYINVIDTTGTKAKPIYTLVTKHFVPGDTAISGNFDISFSGIDYNIAATLGLPTGNDAYGLGAGQVTYNVTNHFEHSFDLFTPQIEVGFGDASTLTDQRILKSYITVGKLANFQAGASFDLPFHLNFQADAYENLPVASQTIFSTTGKGKKKVTTVTTKGAAEDNGFETNLDIPINGHIMLSGFYNRSLRSHIDTAGFSLTFQLKPRPPVIDEDDDR